MPDKAFVDTNIWIYLYLRPENSKDQKKQQQAKKVIQDYENMVISTQVLNEVSNVLYRKYKIQPESVKHYLHKVLSLTKTLFSPLRRNGAARRPGAA
ncbi:MAG: PIN domain-containing protein [Gammaproteobacteria bacterium]|nr:PIN domain-containing protein [Gammaproteobacteria bacterium]